MTREAALRELQAELRAELVGRILPFWMGQAVDTRNGGFAGEISDENVPRWDAPKGAILNARILWTFSAAYRALRTPAYAAAAERAAGYFHAHFVDPEHGGVNWMVDARGAPVDARKHVYAQAFAIYGLGEHAMATGSSRSLDRAIELYGLIERHAADGRTGGYQEAFARGWAPLADVRLSEVDADERRSMNTHLHLLEAYAGLFRAWPDPGLKRRLRELVQLFLDRIVDPETWHLVPFFDESWTPRSRVVSFGHDIEASWLLLEAVDRLDEPSLRARVLETTLRIARAVLEQGLDAGGGLFYEMDPDGELDTNKEWWPQAEAIVGFLNAYEETSDPAFLEGARSTWAFIRSHILDLKHGEWHRRVTREGARVPGHEKVGPWKCPYHNGRACLEGISRIDRLLAGVPAR